MPTTCLVVGCGSRSNRDNVKFYAVPMILNHRFLKHLNELSQERRLKWITAIRRSDLTESKLKNQKVCSKHFISGKPAALEDKNDPDWIPTQNMGHKSFLTKQSDRDIERKKRYDSRKKMKINEPSTSLEPEITDITDFTEDPKDSETGTFVQTDLTTEDLEKQISALKFFISKNISLMEQINKLSFSKESFENNDKKCYYYTGFGSKCLDIVYKNVKDYLPTHFNQILDPFRCLLLTGDMKLVQPKWHNLKKTILSFSTN